MTKITKHETDENILFRISGERLITQYIEKFLIKTPFEITMANHFINCSIAKHQPKIDACKCLLEDIPNSSDLFRAVDAIANQTDFAMSFTLSHEKNIQECSPEYQWLNKRVLDIQHIPHTLNK